MDQFVFSQLHSQDIREINTFYTSTKTLNTPERHGAAKQSNYNNNTDSPISVSDASEIFENTTKADINSIDKCITQALGLKSPTSDSSDQIKTIFSSTFKRRMNKSNGEELVPTLRDVSTPKHKKSKNKKKKSNESILDSAGSGTESTIPSDIPVEKKKVKRKLMAVDDSTESRRYKKHMSEVEPKPFDSVFIKEPPISDGQDDMEIDVDQVVGKIITSTPLEPDTFSRIKKKKKRERLNSNLEISEASTTEDIFDNKIKHKKKKKGSLSDKTEYVDGAQASDKQKMGNGYQTFVHELGTNRTTFDDSCASQQSKKKKKKSKLHTIEEIEIKIEGNSSAERLAQDDSDEPKIENRKKPKKKKCSDINASEIVDTTFTKHKTFDDSSASQDDSKVDKIKKKKKKLKQPTEDEINTKIENILSIEYLAQNDVDASKSDQDYQRKSSKAQIGTEDTTVTVLRKKKKTKLLHPGESKSEIEGADSDSDIWHIQNLDISEPAYSVLHSIETRMSSVPTPDQKVSLQNLNVTIKMGPYTKTEDEIIKQNFAEFCKQHFIPENPRPFLQFHEKESSKSVLARHNRIRFVQWLGRKLENRLLYSIYKRFQHIFGTHKKGKFTEEEDQTILEFMENSYSRNQFSELGKTLNRERTQVQKRYNYLKNSRKVFVPWVPEVARDFLSNLQELAKVENILELENKPIKDKVWMRLSKKMEFDVPALKHFWHNKLLPRLTIDEVLDYDDIREKLIDILHKRGCVDFRAVSWNEIAKEVQGGWTGTEIYRVFKSVVQHVVPNEIQKDLKAVIQYLRKAQIQSRSHNRSSKQPLEFKNGRLYIKKIGSNFEEVGKRF